MKNARLLIVILVLLGGAYYANTISNKNALTAKAIDEAVKKDQAEHGTLPAPSKSDMPDELPPFVDQLPPELIITAPIDYPHKITIGWSFDVESQADPAALIQLIHGIGEFATKHPGRLKVVAQNIDVPVYMRTREGMDIQDLGITLDGASQVNVNGTVVDLTGVPGQDDLVWDKVSPALSALLK